LGEAVQRNKGVGCGGNPAPTELVVKMKIPISLELLKMAEKATHLEGWRWGIGMGVVVQGSTTSGLQRGKVKHLDYRRCPVVDGSWPRSIKVLPDLADPFTGGHLLNLLGEGWRVCSQTGLSGLTVTSPTRLGETGKTLGEACARTALTMGNWMATDTPESFLANDPLYW
tara:strand:- start:5326 stop:5835 length:510 start_codon:yes stop_codon:yes gene_type:complete